ncbi:MAG TPA: Na/Pi symporter [Saprospiraceae bacterium]|nr:Na/Pi symporter [Saprospiraceae bacterium]
MNDQTFNLIISVTAAIVLFLYSLRSFSVELKEFGSDYIAQWLGRITKNRVNGYLFGILITAIIQSSSAVSSIVVALVDSGVLTFFNSLPILLGSNVGTTFTAWLVAFKIENLGSILIVLGTILSTLPYKIHLIGKSVFYLGLILFSLLLISNALKPMSQDPDLVKIFTYANNLWNGIMIGMVVTAIVQSSSVVTGLVIILSQQGLISLEGALAIIIGSNIGTSSTALLASVKMSNYAKKAAKANAFFNFIGVVIFIPFFSIFVKFVAQIEVILPYKIAIAHLVFNVFVSLLFLSTLNIIAQRIFK